MSCPRTPVIVADYFEQRLGPEEAQALNRHVQDCAHCRSEIAALQPVHQSLLSWQDQALPATGVSSIADTRMRGRNAADAGEGVAAPGRGGRIWQQWLPLAACVVLAVAVVFDMQFSRSDSGWTVSFGESAALDRQLQAFEQRQQLQRDQELQQLLTVALQQYGESQSQNLNRIVDYFEQQRRLDMQLMQAGYQQLIDSDYQTVQSVRQLASFVQYGDQP